LAHAEEAARAGLAAGASLAAMAAAAGLGRSRFCELYRRLRGTSPGAFLRAERLRRAQELLAHAELPLAEVARQVGYADATVFGRRFRAATGATPGAWRLSRGPAAPARRPPRAGGG
ncbi:MAG: helix-turn-helix transcriptional regulator, partial [Planctomycetes bacterium]|nr:helix-turn-helix transcriptional regulator [Planctomycetota bacterium]